jgi:murein DD-endopeptidase MepM/ murein hydrolase activator NlpD
MRKYYIGVLVLALLSSFIFAIAVRWLIPVEPIVVEKFIEQPKIHIPTVYEYKFGNSTDSLLTINEKVKRNETFIQILNKFSVPSDKAQEVLLKSKDIFNFRNINAGSKYTVYQSIDSVASTKCIVFEANPQQTIIVKFGDSLSIIKDEKQIEVLKKGIAGKITSSLYESLVEQEAPAQLAYELSQIFATKVDFFKIQPGDNFKIVYDEVQMEGTPIGIEKIHSAYFEHDKQKFYAINFEEDGKPQYYDEQANGMKQGFLKAPLKFFRISSKFTNRRFHPVQKIFKAHLGTDYAAPTGTPILSVGNGTVIEAKYSQFNGNYVKVKHNDTYTTQYLHMSKIAKGMRPGKKITQGQTIGYVGSTGLASGPHVCFRFWKNGKQTDPSSVKAAFTNPLPKSKLEAFNKLKVEMIGELDRIKLSEPVATN